MPVWMAKTLRVLLASAAMLLFVCFLGVVCLTAALRSGRTAVTRVPSPSGALVATLVEVNGGATTAFGCEVRISRPGGWWPGGIKVASLYAAGRCGREDGVHLHWASGEVLQVAYREAEEADAGVPWWAAPFLHVHVELRLDGAVPTHEVRISQAQVVSFLGTWRRCATRADARTLRQGDSVLP